MKRFTIAIAIIVLTLFCIPAQAATRGYTGNFMDKGLSGYNVLAYGATGDGATDDRSAINDTHTAATVNGNNIIFPPGTYKLSSSITFDSDVTLVFQPGAKLSVDNTFTATINGKIAPTLHQIFSGAGTVTLAVNSADHILPQWWGATADGTTNDYPAIAAAIAAASSAGGGVVYFPPGNYHYETTLSMQANVSLVGAGVASVLKPATGGAGVITISTDDHNVTISDLRISPDAVVSAGIIIGGGAEFATIRNVHFDAGVVSFSQCVYLFTCNFVTIQGCTFNDVGYQIVQKSGNVSSNVSVIGNRSFDCTKDFVNLNCTSTAPSWNWTITGNVVKGVGIAPSANFGDSTTQFKIEDQTGNTWRYTYDGTGTDPIIGTTKPYIRSTVTIAAQNFTAENNGTFVVTAVAADYFEVTNESGVEDLNKTIGTGTVKYQTTQVESRFLGITYCDNVTITGNTVEDIGGDSAIHMEGSTGVVITGNTFKDAHGAFGQFFFLTEPTDEGSLVVGDNLFIQTHFITNDSLTFLYDRAGTTVDHLIDNNIFAFYDNWFAKTSATAEAIGVSIGANPTPAQVRGNRFINLSLGINFGDAAGGIVSENYFEECAIGFAYTGVGTSCTFTDNLFNNCAESFGTATPEYRGGNYYITTPITLDSVGSFTGYYRDILPGGLDVTDNITGGNVTSGADVGHTHTGASLSGIDISDDTNLAGGTNATLSDDTLNVDDAFVVNNASDVMEAFGIILLEIKSNTNVAALKITSDSTNVANRDGVIFWNDSGAGVWAVGLDGSDANTYKWSNSTGLGTNDRMSLTTAGELSVLNLTASLLVATNAGKGFASVADLTTWIAGTANQVVVTDDADGSLTLSTPQNIHTAATPTFATLDTGQGANELYPMNQPVLTTSTPTWGDTIINSATPAIQLRLHRSVAAISTDLVYATISFAGTETGGGATDEVGAIIRATGGGSWSANVSPGKLEFLTTPLASDTPVKQMTIDDTGYAIFEAGILQIKETTTPTAVAGYGALYTTSENKLYFQDGAGDEHLVHPVPVAKSYTFKSRDNATGANYVAGYYNSATADANLNEGALTVTHGGANHPYAAHAFIVSGGNGTTDGSDLVLTVTGTSITDGGVRSAADSEVVEATAKVSTTNTYFETTKKWIGTITYTLSSTGGGTFNYDFNYGFAKYEDFGNRAFVLNDIEAVGLADANDASFDIEFLHHKTTGWTYAASGFVPGTTALYKMTTIHSTESDLDSGEPFAFKRSGLSDSIDGSSGEGIIVRITTGAAKAVAYMNLHIGVEVVD